MQNFNKDLIQEIVKHLNFFDLSSSMTVNKHWMKECEFAMDKVNKNDEPWEWCHRGLQKWTKNGYNRSNDLQICDWSVTCKRYGLKGRVWCEGNLIQIALCSAMGQVKWYDFCIKEAQSFMGCSSWIHMTRHEIDCEQRELWVGKSVDYDTGKEYEIWIDVTEPWNPSLNLEQIGNDQSWRVVDKSDYLLSASRRTSIRINPLHVYKGWSNDRSTPGTTLIRSSVSHQKTWPMLRINTQTKTLMVHTFDHLTNKHVQSHKFLTYGPYHPITLTDVFLIDEGDFVVLNVNDVLWVWCKSDERVMFKAGVPLGKILNVFYSKRLEKLIVVLEFLIILIDIKQWIGEELLDMMDPSSNELIHYVDSSFCLYWINNENKVKKTLIIS